MRKHPLNECYSPEKVKNIHRNLLTILASELLSKRMALLSSQNEGQKYEAQLAGRVSWHWTVSNLTAAMHRFDKKQLFHKTMTNGQVTPGQKRAYEISAA
jgi:hypothetical protein